mgnify:CR=1 FL=1
MVRVRDISESSWKKTAGVDEYWKTDVDFVLDKDTVEIIRSKQEDFTLHGLLTFLQNYSRTAEDGTSETWADAVLRVTEGTMYCKKIQFARVKMHWNEEQEQAFARRFATHMFEMTFLPAGRGMWSMSKETMRELQTSIVLNNCAYTSTAPDETTAGDQNLSFAHAAQWMMMVLMLGAGTGFDTDWKGMVYAPSLEEEHAQFYTISDDREGWAFSVYLLMESYLLPNQGVIRFDYSFIRPRGQPIKRYGGISGGPEPLILLHHRLRSYFDCFHRVHTEHVCAKLSIQRMMAEMCVYDEIFAASHADVAAKVDAIPKELKTYNHTRLVVDVINSILVCVADGNLGRSSSIAFAPVKDVEFLPLKDESINPERHLISHMSNNSVCVDSPNEYDVVAKMLPPFLKKNGEPGIFNRYLCRQPADGEAPDPRLLRVKGGNPCMEVPEEPWEFCNLICLLLTKCLRPEGTIDFFKLFEAVYFACMYVSIVTCIPTGEERSDAVISRNHRLGVSLDGSFYGYENMGINMFTGLLRSLREIIKDHCNTYVYRMTGVTPIAHTCFKPGGKIPPLANVLSSINGPIASRYVELRRMLLVGTPLCDALLELNFPHEPCPNNPSKMLFIIPMDQGPCRDTHNVNIWEKLALLSLLQRQFANNAVSTTTDFDISISDQELEKAISAHIHQVRACCFMPYEDFRTLRLLDGNRFQLNTSLPREEAKIVLKKFRRENLISKEEYRRGKGARFRSYAWHPYTAITKEEYERQMKSVPVISSTILCKRKKVATATGVSVRGCDGDRCSLPEN